MFGFGDTSHVGPHTDIMRELAEEDPILYKNFIRMNEKVFNEIVDRVRPFIEKSRTFWREPLDPGRRVAITLV